MPRLSRRSKWTETACYHVFNRGHNRQAVFTDDEDRAYFRLLLQRYRTRFGLRLYHYCLMDNHFHLLLQMDEPRLLSRVMAGLMVAYGHHYHRRHGYVGHLWQGRFKSPAVERDSYLLSCGRYIERNPLEAGLVAKPWDYAWSSCRYYVLGRADDLLSENPCFMELAQTSERRQQLWREFLLDGDPKEDEVRRVEGVVGAEAFQHRLGDFRSRIVRSRYGRPRKAAGTAAPKSQTQMPLGE
jgi:putative transposase